MIPKVTNLSAQGIELHQVEYDKIQKDDPRIGSYKCFEETFFPSLYKYKDKFLNDISYDLLVHVVNRI